MNITSKIINMSPEMSIELLKKNAINRPITKSKVVNYCNQMKAGQWMLNGEGIIISEDGFILNGQHRLYGIIMSGVTVQILVLYGIKKESFSTIDTGKSRTAADVISINGNGARLSQILATQVRLNIIFKNTGGVAHMPNYNHLTTPKNIAIELEKDEDYLKAAEFINSFSKTIIPYSSGQMAFLAYRFFKIDKDFSEPWLTDFITGSNLSSDDYRLWVRNKFWRNTNNVAKMKTSVKSLLLIKAWDWAIKGKVIQHEKALRADSVVLKYISLPSDLVIKD